MDYNIRRNRNVTRGNSAKSDFFPLDLMASKFDETDMYVPDDAFNRFAREAIVSRTPDKVYLPEDERPTRAGTTSGVLNLRMNGHRGSGQDPANSEAFFGDLDHGKDRAGMIDVAPELRAQSKFRERYQAYKGEGGNRMMAGVWTEQKVREGRDKTINRMKREAKIFSGTKENLTYSAGSQSHSADARYAVEDEALHATHTEGEQNLYDGSATVPGQNKVAQRAPSSSSVDDANFAVAQIGAHGKSARFAKDATGANRSISGDNTFASSSTSRVQKSIAGIMQDVIASRKNIQGDTSFAQSIIGRLGKNARQRDSDPFAAQRERNNDVILAEERMSNLGRNSARHDTTRALKDIEHEAQLAAEYNAKTVAKNMRMKDSSLIRTEALSDPQQFAAERVASAYGKNARPEYASLAYEGLHTEIKHEEYAIHSYSTQHKQPTGMSGRMDIVDDAEHGDAGEAAFGRTASAKDSTRNARERRNELADDTSVMQNTSKKGTWNAPRPAYVDRTPRDDAREI